MEVARNSCLVPCWPVLQNCKHQQFIINEDVRTLPLRLSFDASTPHLWRWMHAMLCNGQWQEKRNRQGETGETLKILEDPWRSWKESLQFRKFRKDILVSFFEIFLAHVWSFEAFSREFFGWTTLLKGQLFRVQDQAACCLPTPQWAFWTQASADEVLYMAKDLRRDVNVSSFTWPTERNSTQPKIWSILLPLRVRIDYVPLSYFEKQACHSLRTCGRGTRLPGKIRKAKSLVIKCWHIQVFDCLAIHLGSLFSMFKGT